MSTLIKNSLEYLYTIDGTSAAIGDVCEAVKETTIPNVNLHKTCSPTTFRKGDTVTYTATIEIGDGDTFNELQVIRDTPDENTEFIDGTLKIDGIVHTSQDITNIHVTFLPNSNHTIEYKMICL